VEWEKGHFARAEGAAEEAMEQWRANMARYPFCSICLWPLVAVRRAEGHDEEAVDATREPLRPPQMRLPPRLETVLTSALPTWDEGSHAGASRRLAQALRLAEKLRFI
jgi:hypothetical protein